MNIGRGGSRYEPLDVPIALTLVLRAVVCVGDVIRPKAWSSAAVGADGRIGAGIVVQRLARLCSHPVAKASVKTTSAETVRIRKVVLDIRF